MHIFEHDLTTYDRHWSADLKEIRNNFHLNLETGPWLAGGAAEAIARNLIRNDTVGIRDWDIFHSPTSISRTTLHSRAHIDDVLFRHFRSLDELLNDFDFTCAQWATDGKTLIARSLDTVHHTRELVLVPTSPTDRPNPYRLVKYIDKGYIPTPEAVNQKLIGTKITNGLIDVDVKY